MPEGWDHLWVGALGALIGAGELVSRYRDEPGRVLRTIPAYAYLFLNVISAIGALQLIRMFGWSFGFTTQGAALRCTQVLVAGTAAMALLRSSLFVVRLGNQDVRVGPSSFLDVFLASTDRAVDRRRATERDVFLSGVMKGISFEKAKAILPARCIGLMQNLTPAEQAEVGRQVDAIAAMAHTDQQKAELLGLALLNLVGERVLRQVVNTLHNDIKS